MVEGSQICYAGLLDTYLRALVAILGRSQPRRARNVWSGGGVPDPQVGRLFEQ